MDNGTAFQMDNTSTRASGACNGSNIFLRVPFTTNALGNTTYVNVTGASDFNIGCAGPPQLYSIENYTSPQP